MYSHRFAEGVQAGKARLEGVDASYKDLAEVCANVRGMKLSEAMTLLEKASLGTFPIRFRKYISGLAHRKELCGRPGRYPKKSAAVVLGVLKSAVASAKAKGMSEDLVVVHACANMKSSLARLAPKGKRMRSNYETSRVEIVVVERTPTKAEMKKAAEKPGAKAVAKAEAKPHVPEAKAEAKAPEQKPASEENVHKGGREKRTPQAGRETSRQAKDKAKVHVE
jgi:large subunit ribosomal protein L17e